jgi:hypothetical protein
MGKTLDVYDVEVHPPGATRDATITVDDDVCQALEERATRCEMTVQEQLVALGAAILLGELNPPKDLGNAREHKPSVEAKRYP